MHNESFLHRLIAIKPGNAPAWLCSCNRCMGFDVLTGITTALIFFGMALFSPPPALGVSHPWIASICCLMGIGFGFGLVIPFETCERKARARRRQETEREKQENVPANPH
jgi:hypothetical protein